MSVLTEHRDGALVPTINRPDAGNSLNPAVGRGLVDALANAADDPEVSTIVITGAGEKIFIAGMDLKAFSAGDDMTPLPTRCGCSRSVRNPSSPRSMELPSPAGSK